MDNGIEARSHHFQMRTGLEFKSINSSIHYYIQKLFEALSKPGPVLALEG